jgi:hypothetical protein
MPNPLRVCHVDLFPFVVAPHPYDYITHVYQPAATVTESMFGGIDKMMADLQYDFCWCVERDAFMAVQSKGCYTYSAQAWEGVVGAIECLKMRLDVIARAAAERATARRNAAHTTDESVYVRLREEHEEERSRLARAADEAAAAEREAAAAAEREAVTA